MKNKVPAAIGAAIASVAAPALMLLGATTAQADPAPVNDNDQVTSDPAPQQSSKYQTSKEWFRSNGTVVMF